jgi:uncharacterized protein YajQ (UPF0234 family)
MASNASFDISTGADLQEVDNAVNQALKEVAQRYDFKGTHCTIEFDRTKAEIRLAADDEFRMDALLDVLQGRMIKRGVPVKNLKRGEIIPSAGSTVKQVITLQQGIPIEAAKEIVKHLKDLKKKVQGAIQSDQVRVSSQSKDELQAAMQALRAKDFGVALQFGNYR